MPKWMSGFVVKRLTTKAIMAAKKHSIQGELIWLTGKIRSCSLCNFLMLTWLCNNQFKNIKSLSTSLLTDFNRLRDLSQRKYKRNHFSDPIGEEFLNEYGFTEIEADFSAKTMTLCKIKLLSKSFRSYLIDKIAKKCANRYRNAHQKLNYIFK